MSDNKPHDLKYLKSHEWARVENDLVVVGVSDYAVEQMNREIIHVELPETGMTVAREDSFGVIDSVKAAFDIFTPVGGTIVEVNEAVNATPELVAQSPYEEGWLIKIKPSNLESDLAKLLSAEEYQDSIEV